MDKKKFSITPKTRRKFPAFARVLVQLFFFIMAPEAFSTAFMGVKYIFGRIGEGQPISLNSLVMMLIALCLFTILFGRFFCGFACPFGAAGDWLHALYVFICKKRKKKPRTPSVKEIRLTGAIKYLLLSAIVLMSFFGVYGITRGMSPWDAFSFLLAGIFPSGEYVIGFVLLLLIAAGMFFEERFFCRVICPMGAVFSLLPALPIFTLHRTRESCIKKCSRCTGGCPSAIELPEIGDPSVSGDCYQCQKCTTLCPKKNIRTGLTRRLKGNEIWFILLRAALLFAAIQLVSNLP